MHYYKFNISSWSKDVAHLSLEEEAIYFRLINYYYDTEKPIPLKTQMVFRKLRLATHQEAAEMILEEFFEKTEEGWKHHHCEKVVEAYQNLAERNRKNGKGGGRPKINNLDKPSGLSVGSEQETQSDESGNLNYKRLNQEPKNQQTIEKKQRIKDAFDEFWSSYHLKKNKSTAERAFTKAVKNVKDLDEFVSMLVKDCKARLSSGEFGFDRLHASTYLNNNRWEDEVSLPESQNKTENSISSGFYDGYIIR